MIKKHMIVTGGLVVITVLLSAILTNPLALADDSHIDTMSVSVPESCTLTSNGMNSHSEEINNGQTNEQIGETTIKVFCNDNTGYALYAIGYTDDEYGKNVLVNSAIDSSYNIATAATITTGTSSWAMKLTKTGSDYLPIIAGSSIDTNAQTGDPDFSDFAAVPAEYTKVAYYLSSTDMGATASGSNLTTTYRAYISPTQPAGTYVGQVKYTLVHPSTAGKPVAPLKPTDCPKNSICYVPNANDVQGSMKSIGTATPLNTVSPEAGKQSASANSTATLIAPNFYRPGYGFAGWSTEFDAVATHNANIASNSNETVTIYGPNETISTNPSNGGVDISTNGLILYPVWIVPTGTLQGNNNQGWTGCSLLDVAPADGTRATLSSMTALTDTRDNNVYTVARLADGKCWMTENLRLNSEDTISSKDIAASQGYGDATNSAQGNLGKFIGLASSEDANFSDSSTANSLYSIDGSNGTININSNSNYYPGYRMPRFNKNNTNVATNATNSNNTTILTDNYNANNNHVRWYSYGNYYTWPAAIADTAHYNQNNTSVTTTSICPAGWYLPQGGQAYVEGNTSGVNVTGDATTYRDFYNLGFILMGSDKTAYEDTPSSGYAYYSSSTINAAGDTATNAFRKFPNNFVCSGYFHTSTTYSRGSNGYYWSSSARDSIYAYHLRLDSSSVLPGTYYGNKNRGFSVRCISQ